jgi:hypothetical protein
MGRVCSTQRRDKQWLQNVDRSTKGKVTLENIGIDGRIVSKLILNK